jgi:DNA mismatch repair protein MutL
MNCYETRQPSSSAPGKIVRLPSELINQIAAGEVVERPASLIKELVENSLDAGATRIEVHLTEGGLKEITLIDNGCGISTEDLPIAIERHTTSKLKSLTDLEKIATFGFRGEALSSIASVADFSIRSRPQNQAHGMSLHVPYGEKQELKPVGCPPGTQICVKDLFAKIPARFKFLRAQATELSHCVRVIKELALGNPEVAFFVYHNGRLLSKYTSYTRKDRLLETLKHDWEPLEFQDSIEEMKYEALLSPLDWTQERGEILLFINQRPVKNRLLLAGIKNSFIEVAGPHHEPSGAFWLDIRGDWVDVNVHPQKLEVRFYRQEKVYGWLITSLKKQLSKMRSPQFKDSNPLVSLTLPEPLPPSLLLNSSHHTAPRWLGVLGSGLWVIENLDGLYLVNPKALQQRKLYLELTQIKGEKRVHSQPLAIASILSIPQELHSTLETHLSLFSLLGFDIELFGDRDVALKSLPFFLPESQAEENFLKLLNTLTIASPKPPVEQLWTQALRTLITLIPSTMTNEVISSPCLMDSLLGIDESWTCPLGNPVLLKLSWTQLEQHFKTL